MTKTISLRISEEQLEKIDKARLKTFHNRNSFILYALEQLTGELKNER